MTERVWFEELVNLPITPQLECADMHYMADCVGWAMRRLAGPPQQDLGKSA